MTQHSGLSEQGAEALYAAPRIAHRQRPWLLLMTAIVLAFELSMLWLARDPQVDDHYRRYFIDHATTCYRPIGEVPVIEMGNTYAVRKGEVLGNCGVLWAGFYSPKEDQAVSARLAEVTLRLKVAPGLHQPVVVGMDLSRYPDNAEPLPVQVVVNGTLLTHWPVGGSKERFEVDIPERLIASDGSISMTLKGPPPIAPRDVGLNANKFPIGLRLDVIALHSSPRTTAQKAGE
ncbi:hypothetical protein [Cobetia crustatorum]|uniref:Uncharacterized protein n=1 Tax=Cobetia crustatorum TaxID=553385 RepID=A0A558HWS4_9GAMM|nr:hypothetical protein [Cobetia crustatorum]TVU73549.1 hypothetical protein FQP86_00230 [Cobetia crustatorum]